MHAVIVDEDKCVSCKTCYKACWADVIRWDDQRDLPVIAYPEDCVVCNFCEISCTEAAITVVVDYSLPFPCSYIDGQS